MKLTALEGLPAGSEYRLGPGPLTIGRSASCSVIVDGEGVSNEHCRIQPSGDGFVIEDLKSRNGTIVNDSVLKRPTLLQPGDLVVIGRALFEVSESRLPATSSPGKPAAIVDAASTAREAALAGEALRRQLTQTLSCLAKLESEAGGSLEMVPRLDRVGEAELRRILAVCRAAAASENPDQLTRILSSEAAALYRAVAAAREGLFASNVWQPAPGRHQHRRTHSAEP